MENNNIDLICPSCSKENKIILSSNIKCKECNETLIGRTYKEFILPIMITIGLSAIGGAMLDDTININRASVKTEYKMMRTCVNKFQDSDGCVCTVEAMSGLLDATKARFYTEEWLREVLIENYKDCKD